MIRPKLLSIVFLLFFLKSMGQAPVGLKSKIITADTILLVSHMQTDGMVIMNDSTGERRQPQKVVLNGRPNMDVITGSKVLDGSKRLDLLRILTQPEHDKKIETCNCFIPFHSLLFIKDGKTSYIDICFSCNTFIISDDSEPSPIYMGKKKRKELASMFDSNGISVNVMSGPEQNKM